MDGQRDTGMPEDHDGERGHRQNHRGAPPYRHTLLPEGEGLPDASRVPQSLPQTPFHGSLSEHVTPTLFAYSGRSQVHIREGGLYGANEPVRF